MAVSPFGQRKPLKCFSTLKLPEQPRHNIYRRQRVFEKRRKGTLETATTNYTILPVFLSIFASIFFLSGLSHLPSTRLLTQTTPPYIKSLTSMFMLPQDQPCHFTTFPFVTTPGMFPLNQPLLPFTRHEALQQPKHNSLITAHPVSCIFLLSATLSLSNCMHFGSI